MFMLHCFNLSLLVLQVTDLGIVEVLTFVELLVDLLLSKLSRVDREDLFTGQLSVVLLREEEVLHCHVGPAELSVLYLDLKPLAIAKSVQTVT